MKSIMLLPNKFKVNGLWMSLTGLLGMWFVASGGLINVFRILKPGDTWPDGSYPYPPTFMPINGVIGHISVTLLIAGLLFFFFSKEKDEYLYHVRLEALQFAVIWQLAITVLLGLYFSFFGTMTLENVLPIIVMVSAMGFWLLFVGRYCYVAFLKSRQED